MDQEKIGGFLKELRKEKNFTQEQLAEQFGVSRRTVSRWENGNNLPDLDILLEMSDFYEVDLRELLDGERKPVEMVEEPEKELEETVIRMAEYNNDEKERIAKGMRYYFIAGLIALFINQAMFFMVETQNFWTGFIKGSSAGLAACAMAFGVLYTTGYLTKLFDSKKRIGDKAGDKED